METYERNRLVEKYASDIEITVKVMYAKSTFKYLMDYEDFVQEAFLNVIAYADKWDKRLSSFKTFAKNKAIWGILEATRTRVDTKKTVTETCFINDLEPEPIMISDDKTAEKIDRTILMNIILSNMHLFNPTEKITIKGILSGMTQLGIANSIGMTAAAISKAVRSARKKVIDYA